MQSLRVTLYEVFGYIAPGIVALAAMLVGVWAIYYPAAPLPTAIPAYNAVEFGAIAFIAYMLGHLVQALGNLLTKAEKRPKLCRDCDDMLKLATIKLRAGYGVETQDVSMSDAVSLAQAALSQSGNVNDYEVFVYREGFYRGAAISLLLCSLAFCIRALHPTQLLVGRGIVTIPISLLLIASLTAAITAIFFYLRFRRFGEYRIRHVLSVIAIISPGAHFDQSSNKEK